jgi:hypothetical protein
MGLLKLTATFVDDDGYRDEILYEAASPPTDEPLEHIIDIPAGQIVIKQEPKPEKA